MKAKQYYEGDVFQSGHKFRRVIAIVSDSRGRKFIAYSTGGNKTHRCMVRSFRKFKDAGKMIHAGRDRPQAG